MKNNLLLKPKSSFELIGNLSKLVEQANLLSRELANSTINSKQESQNELTQANENVSPKLLDFFGEFAAMIEEKKRGHKICLSRERDLIFTHNLLKEYCPEISFENFNTKINSDFLNFCFSKEYTNPTVKKHLKIIKSFVNWSFEKGYHQKSLAKDVKIDEKKSIKVYLTTEEIKMISEVKLNKGLDKVRDVFLIGVYSGQRFSDYSVFDNSDLIDGFIIKEAKKTDETSYIPVDANQKLRALLDKYNWLLPKFCCEYFNKKLKIIGKMAGLVSKVKLIQHRGQEKCITIDPKYKHLSSHTARRTFITLSLEKGMNPHVIMKITGIKKIETLFTYSQVDKRQIFNQMKNYWG